MISAACDLRHLQRAFGEAVPVAVDGVFRRAIGVGGGAERDEERGEVLDGGVCANGMPGARSRKLSSSSTSPWASASAQVSNSDDQPGTASGLLQSMNGGPWVM